MKKELSDDDRAVIIGWNLGKQPGSNLAWLYTPRPELCNLSPKVYLDSNGDPEEVEKIFCSDFGTVLEFPDFIKK